MRNNDFQKLEEAYIAVAKKSSPSVEPNETVSTGPMDEPAPGVDMDMIDSEVEDTEPEEMDTTGIPVEMEMGDEDIAAGDPRLSEEDENEEDEMTIDNLNAIRESIMKIASHCAAGDHLEPWQQQKLAIAMDNLAEVARRLH
jgi:hypothetical protein